MLRIARLTDYAMVFLTHMARRPHQEVYTSSDLAEATNVPPPTVSKVLKALTQEGILVSHRGVHGGYSLARDPDEVNLAQVIAALEGPIAITLCGEGPGACDLEAGCAVSANWLLINRSIQDALERVSLADMTRPLDPAILNVAAGSDGQATAAGRHGN